MGSEVHAGMDLPPGFRFHPTDEEIITHYLSGKLASPGFTATAMGDVDLNKCEPWDLPCKAKMGEEEWYFFCHKDRKYPSGMRTNRATEAGYWKATGKDKEIYRGKRVLVGMKKTLVFYKGRAPKGQKTNWVMHEFRVEGAANHFELQRSLRDEWVVCRVFHKGIGTKKSSSSDDSVDPKNKPASMAPLQDLQNSFLPQQYRSLLLPASANLACLHQDQARDSPRSDQDQTESRLGSAAQTHDIGSYWPYISYLGLPSTSGAAIDLDRQWKYPNLNGPFM